MTAEERARIWREWWDGEPSLTGDPEADKLLLGMMESTVRVQIEKAEEARDQAIIKLALEGILGPPKRYNWAKQNYNGGWDQSRHNLIREIRDGRVGGDRGDGDRGGREQDGADERTSGGEG
jgi:hypothetical protein